MKIIVFIVLSCLAVTASTARVARVLYYGAPPSAPNRAVVHQFDKSPEEVALDRHNFSESFELSEGSVRLFFLPSVLPEGEPTPSGAPFVNIPEDWEKVLILVFPDASNPVMPIRLQAMNASDDVFIPGAVLFVNFSEMTVFGKVGNQRLVSRPKTVEYVLKPIEERGSYIIKLDTFKDDPKKRRPLVQQKCQYHPEIRVITFISPLPPPRMVKLYSVPIPDL